MTTMTAATVEAMRAEVRRLDALARYSDRGLSGAQKTRHDELRQTLASDDVRNLERDAGEQAARDVLAGRGKLEDGSPRRTDAVDQDRPLRGSSESRARALDVLDATERSDLHLTRPILDTVARAVESDDSDDFARYVLVAGDQAYRSAFHKMLRNPTMGQYEWTEAERAAFGRAQQLQRAMAIGADSTGGFMVPLALDPAIILTNGGTSNRSLRSAFTVKTTAGTAWRGVTSAGVTAEWKAEGLEVADASPTLGEAEVAAHKGDAFIPFSFEVQGDAVGFAAEMAKLLTDAKERLEAAAFITGSGSGQPKGLVTAAVAASKTVASATADTYALADVYALKKALPTRWRPGAAWLANEDVWDLTRQLIGDGTAWADFDADRPSRLLGRQVYESSEMDGTVTASATNYLAVYGDLKQYYVVDRVGTTIELVNHLFGDNGRPNGQRGFLMWFRTGGDLVVPDAVRVLNA